MISHQLGGSDGQDTRFPDWHMILQEMADPSKCVVQFRMENLLNGDTLRHVRLAALYTTSPPHVVAVIVSGPNNVRIYDNESQERLEGTFINKTVRQLAPPSGPCWTCL